MKYAIGLDYGTLSGRAVLAKVDDGEIVATSVYEYPHAVMDERLPDGTSLPPDWALQHPQDYLDVVVRTIPDVIAQSGVDTKDIVGIGVDFTACTVMPVLKDGRVLCMIDEWKGNPHAYVKLWKHHAAQCDADRLNKIAEENGYSFLKRYGGKISSEWSIPKLMQVVREAPEVYEAMDQWMEATDWIVMQLCGSDARSACTAGFKAMWSKREGFPDNSFFKLLDPVLDGVIGSKISENIRPLGECAGGITAEMAKLTGLVEGTPVSVGNVDAHVAVPPVGMTRAGDGLMIMGTSTCFMMVSGEEVAVPGICGYVEDGILPGYTAYEAGQSCVGDHFEWFVSTLTNSEYEREARELGISIHELLTLRASKLRPGESGLIALDWWNGNRSVLVDVDLTGMMLGMTLTTKPEEIYRALIEATAYGANKIVQNYNANGVAVERLFACGGICEKNPMLMQIYADVTGLEIYTAASKQTVALGSAMFGAVAAGVERGGYDTIFEAIEKMSDVNPEPYRPNPQSAEIYQKLYAEYEILHDYFGRGANDVMKRLKAIKSDARKQ